MKYCAEYGALLDAFVDGELSSGDSARVREHLKTCGGCRSYVDAALAIRDAFPDVEDTEVPADFAAVVMTAIGAGAAPRKTVLSQTEQTPAQAPVRRTGWKKILLPLAACFALAVLVRGIPMGGGSSGSTASPSAAADNAAAVGEAAAAAESPAAYAGGEAREAVQDAEEAAPAAGEPEAGTADRTAKSQEEKNVFYSASRAASSADMEDSGAPATLTESVSPDTAAGCAPSVSSSGSDGVLSVSVTLTAEQRKSLIGLLEGYALTEEGPPAVYRLTSAQLQDLLAELERLDISATVTEPPDGKASGDCRLYVSPSE